MPPTEPAVIPFSDFPLSACALSFYHTHIHADTPAPCLRIRNMGKLVECPGTLSGNSCLCWWAPAKETAPRHLAIFLAPVWPYHSTFYSAKTTAATFPYCNFFFALHTFRITEFFRAQALKNMLNIEWTQLSGGMGMGFWSRLAEWNGGGGSAATMRSNTGLIKTILKPVKTHSPLAKICTHTYAHRASQPAAWQLEKRPSAFGLRTHQIWRAGLGLRPKCCHANLNVNKNLQFNPKTLFVSAGQPAIISLRFPGLGNCL